MHDAEDTRGDEGRCSFCLTQQYVERARLANLEFNTVAIQTDPHSETPTSVRVAQQQNFARATALWDALTTASDSKDDPSGMKSPVARILSSSAPAKDSNGPGKIADSGTLTAEDRAMLEKARKELMQEKQFLAEERRSVAEEKKQVEQMLHELGWMKRVCCRQSKLKKIQLRRKAKTGGKGK